MLSLLLPLGVRHPEPQAAGIFTKCTRVPTSTTKKQSAEKNTTEIDINANVYVHAPKTVPHQTYDEPKGGHPKAVHTLAKVAQIVSRAHKRHAKLQKLIQKTTQHNARSANPENKLITFAGSPQFREPSRIANKYLVGVARRLNSWDCTITRAKRLTLRFAPNPQPQPSLFSSPPLSFGDPTKHPPPLLSLAAATVPTSIDARPGSDAAAVTRPTRPTITMRCDL